MAAPATATRLTRTASPRRTGRCGPCSPGNANTRGRGAEFTFRSDELNQLGYAQWAGGYVTDALLRVPSVVNIERVGYWKCIPERYQADLIEFSSQAYQAGYFDMGIDVPDARALLKTMSSASPEAQRFRTHLVGVHTTYYCEDGGENVDFDSNRDESCTPGTAYYLDDNPHGNFTIDGEYAALSGIMDEQVWSSREQCEEIEEMYLDCINWEDDPDDIMQVSVLSLLGKASSFTAWPQGLASGLQR